MITYNRKDYNLVKIEDINSDYNFLRTKLPYYVYGLTQKDNPPVLFTQNYEGNPRPNAITELQLWLKSNGVPSDIEEQDYDDPESRKFYIGLRKDVRASPEFAAALVRTMVAFFEGQLDLTTSFKIPKVKLKKSSWIACTADDEGED